MKTQQTKNELSGMISALKSGAGILTLLTNKQIAEIVGQFAPYGEDARNYFFDGLREYADKVHPCVEDVAMSPDRTEPTDSEIDAIKDEHAPELARLSAELEARGEI